MVDDRSYSIFVTLVPEHLSGSGKKVHAMYRIVAHTLCSECGRETENRFAVFMSYVERVKDGSLAEARGIWLPENPDWRKKAGDK